MGKNNVDWNDVETWHRMCACIIASGVKIDYRKAAQAFGTTYDTIENRFRKIKAEARVIEKEVANGERTEVTPPRNKSASATPKKSKTPTKGVMNGVSCGRVSKPAGCKTPAIKKENDDAWQDIVADLYSEKDQPPTEDDVFTPGWDTQMA